MRRNTFAGVLTVCCIAFPASQGLAQNTCSARCPNGSMSESYACNSNYVPRCLRAAPAPNPNVNNNNGAAAAKADSDAAAQRQRDANAEQQRVDAENQRRAEEAEKQAKFDQDKQDALGQLKGVASGDDFDSATGLKGLDSTDSGLKDAPSSAGSGALKTGTAGPVLSDPMVVDARNVPTGLPRSVAAEIPETPAGDRVRKGFEAIQDHDWKVALAWFQDARNHDPGNAGIQRLVELAEYTMRRANRPHPSATPAKPPPEPSAQDQTAMAAVDKQMDLQMNADDIAKIHDRQALDKQMDDQMNADLARSLDDFNRNYLPRHPELPKPVKASAPPQTAASPAPQPSPPDEKANWKVFFDSLFTRPPRVLIPTSVSGVRD